MQMHNVGSGPKARTNWTNFQDQDELTRLSWNVQFDKEREKQVVIFNEKLTRCQPITNIVSR
jgi:hypothetical protein